MQTGRVKRKLSITVLGQNPYFVFCGAGIAVRRRGAASGQQKVGAGFCPQKGVWQLLAVSQMLCLPHPRVGKIVSSPLSASIRTAGRCSVVSPAFLFIPRKAVRGRHMPRIGISPKRRDSGPNPACIRREGQGTLPLPKGGHTAPHTAKQGENVQGGHRQREKFALSLYCVAGFDKRREQSLGPRHTSTLQNMPALP